MNNVLLKIPKEFENFQEGKITKQGQKIILELVVDGEKKTLHGKSEECLVQNAFILKNKIEEEKLDEDDIIISNQQVNFSFKK